MNHARPTGPTRHRGGPRRPDGHGSRRRSARRSSSESAWPTPTPTSTRRSGRSSWPGTVAACRRSAADDDGPTFEARHRAATGRPAFAAAALPPRLADAIARRLGGDRRVRIDLDLRGHSPFEQDVWRKALEIPRGEVRPYGWVAAEIGRPQRRPGGRDGPRPQPGAADRAVPPRRPDRRLDRPVLARRAGQQADDPAQRGPRPRRPRGRGGGRRSATSVRTRRTSCACRRAACRRVMDVQRRPFRSLKDGAAAAGYRPCKVCRPEWPAGTSGGLPRRHHRSTPVQTIAAWAGSMGRSPGTGV